MEGNISVFKSSERERPLAFLQPDLGQQTRMFPGVFRLCLRLAWI